MAQAARDNLLVPSAEVGVERLFSGAWDVLGLRRHSMNAETIYRPIWFFWVFKEPEVAEDGSG